MQGQRIMKVSNSKCVGKTSFLLTYFTEGTDENKEDVGGHHQNTLLYLAAVTCNLSVDFTQKERNNTRTGNNGGKEKHNEPTRR